MSAPTTAPARRDRAGVPAERRDGHVDRGGEQQRARQPRQGRRPRRGVHQPQPAEHDGGARSAPRCCRRGRPASTRRRRRRWPRAPVRPSVNEQRRSRHDRGPRPPRQQDSRRAPPATTNASEPATLLSGFHGSRRAAAARADDRGRAVTERQDAPGGRDDVGTPGEGEDQAAAPTGDRTGCPAGSRGRRRSDGAARRRRCEAARAG